MTIALVAKSIKHRCFVSISDRMISFEDEVPAIDNAMFKDLPIHLSNWNVIFAADNPDFVLPIWRGTTNYLANSIHVQEEDDRIKIIRQPSLAQVQEAMYRSYLNVVQQYVMREYLTKFGFKTIDEFRVAGVSQLGRKFFGSLTRKIDRFNAGVEFVVYGFDHTADKSPHMFKVRSPGNAINLDHLGFYAIGSGTKMAIASLNLRPLENLSAGGLAYRLCEAKFSAETASGVGKTTTGFIMNMNGHSSLISFGTINKFRSYLEKWKAEPPPKEITDQIVEIPDLPD